MFRPYLGDRGAHPALGFSGVAAWTPVHRTLWRKGHRFSARQIVPKRSPRAVSVDLGLLDCSETTCHHLVEDRQKCVDLILGIDKLDREWKIFGRAKDLPCVQTRRMSIAELAS